jgi:hypothetical protein
MGVHGMAAMSLQVPNPGAVGAGASPIRQPFAIDHDSPFSPARKRDQGEAPLVVSLGTPMDDDARLKGALPLPSEDEEETGSTANSCATTSAVALSSLGTMSFSAYYEVAESLAPQDYLGRWVDYGRLRRMLARVKELRAQGGERTPFCECELLAEECVCVRPPGDVPGA